MKLKVFIFLVFICLASLYIIGANYVNNELLEKINVYEYEGKDYKTIGINTYMDNIETDIALLADIQEQENIGNDFNKLNEMIKANSPSIFASSYIDEHGYAIYQFTSRDVELEKELLIESDRANKVKFEIVKYSEEELKEGMEVVTKKIQEWDFGASLIALDLKRNKVSIYTSKENRDNFSASLVELLPKDMIHWHEANISYHDQTEG